MGLYSCAFGRDCEDWVHIFVRLWDFLVWWLHMNMVVVEGSLVDILVQWIACVVDSWFVGRVIPVPIHLEDFASMIEPKIMS